MSSIDLQSFVKNFKKWDFSWTIYKRLFFHLPQKMGKLARFLYLCFINKNYAYM